MISCCQKKPETHPAVKSLISITPLVFSCAKKLNNYSIKLFKLVLILLYHLEKNMAL